MNEKEKIESLVETRKFQNDIGLNSHVDPLIRNILNNILFKQPYEKKF